MTSTRTECPTPLAGQRRRTQGSLLVAAIVYAATAIFDIAARPASQHALHSWREYVLSALLVPFALAMLAALVELHALQRGACDPLGRTGIRTAAVGLALFIVDAGITLVSGNTDTAGPLYPIAMLVSLIGIVLFAVAAFRAAVLPRWTMPAIAIAWIIGGPTGEGVIFRGAALILAVVFLAVIAACRPRLATPAVEPAV